MDVQQMNINSTISHYQGGIIMMNAILYRVSQQGRKKKKKQEILKVKKLVQVDKREQVWGGNCF